jgi:RNA ligase (TIGR02306 family)
MEDGREGFRLKTIMLKDQVSQGLVMHLSDAIKGPLNLEDYSVGDDLTEKLGVTKYQPPVKLNTEGIIGFIPGFIRKTDEERIQNLSSDYESYKGKDFFFF